MAEKDTAGAKQVTLAPPWLSEAFQVEHSIHRPSRLLLKDIEIVFRPDLEAEYERKKAAAAAGAQITGIEEKEAFLRANLLAVPTWQPAQQDLSEISDAVNEERRALLKNFDAWADAVRARLGVHWSDASCPVEGCAHFGTPGSTIYNELEGLTTLLRYDSLPIGCCGIVLHPKWQRRAYPVTFFTTAPYDVLQAAILGAEAERAAQAQPAPMES